jgi:pimeloyl-ACP methyl ester carboxylesterase/DNA-binding winged helix-turn-helix (wHTH) protein
MSVQFLFSDHRLDTGRRELYRGSEQIAVEPQVFDLLAYLVENRDRVVSKEDIITAVWGGRIVSDSTLNSRINAARKAISDSGKTQRLIRTSSRKGFRFIGTVDEPDRANKPAVSEDASLTDSVRALRQEIHFCLASDGVRIAYAEVGRGPPLVKAANWLNHLEYDWESPIWRHLLQALASEHRLIRHDQRGNGLSDRDVDDISFDAFVRDLESVVDASNLERFPLLGISQGCAISIAYALRHPQRVSHLVLYGGFARGWLKRNPEDAEKFEAMTTLMRHGWGQENPAFRQMFTSQFIPGGTVEQMRWLNDLQRITASPDNAVRIMKTLATIDLTDVLPQVRIPTLVLHCRSDARVPFEEGRRLAAGIPGAQFVALEGYNHLVLETEPAWIRLLDEIQNFLRC